MACNGRFLFPACSSGRAVGDHVGHHAMTPQHLRKVYGLQRPLSILACSSGRAVGDHVGHLAMTPQRLRRSKARCGDGRAVSDHVGRHVMAPHRLQRYMAYGGRYPFSYAVVAVL